MNVQSSEQSLPCKLLLEEQRMMRLIQQDQRRELAVRQKLRLLRQELTPLPSLKTS
jgi:hypothetical protein